MVHLPPFRNVPYHSSSFQGHSHANAVLCQYQDKGLQTFHGRERQETVRNLTIQDAQPRGRVSIYPHQERPILSFRPQPSLS